MFLQSYEKKSVDNFLMDLKLHNPNNKVSKDKAAKIGQIISYLEMIDSQVRRYSKKRELIFVDSCAGNCYLSFVINFYYTKIKKRKIKIHCLDLNSRLMKKNEEIAKRLGFSNMSFHGCDVADFTINERPDFVYTLHACDKATDKSILLGIQHNAKNIFSVSCCQHSIKLKKNSTGNKCKGITKNQVFKNRIIYMVADSLRALLLEMQGYKVDVVEFASSRYTDKNVLIRARIDQVNNFGELKEEYDDLKSVFNITPSLENYLEELNLIYKNSKVKLKCA